MMKVNRVRALSILTLTLVCGLASGVALNWRAWAQRFSPLVPYTASVVEKHVNPDGTEQFRRVRTIAHSSDGSRAVHEYRYYKLRNGESREHPVNHIWNTKAKQLVSIYPLIGARVTFQLRDQAVQSLTAKPDARCMGGRDWTLDEATPYQTLAGKRVIPRRRQLRTTDGLHVGPVEREWVAPELDCLVMRREVSPFDEQGNPAGTTTTDVIEVTVGEPSAEIFAVSPDLREMSPSQVMRAQNEFLRVECTECALNTAENADRRYYANRPISPN